MEDLLRELPCEFILIIGPTGSGKTSIINQASGSRFKVGHGLRSCTSQIHYSAPFKVDGRKVVLFDTPGFDDTKKSDVTLFTEIATFLGSFYEMKQKFIGVIYMHDISITRVSGITVRNIGLFKAAVGEVAAKNVVVVASKWDLVDSSVAEQRQAELMEEPDFFSTIMKAGGTMQKHGRGDSPLGIIRYILQKHHVTLEIQREMVDEGKKLNETAAGDILNQEIAKALAEVKVAHQIQMDELKRHMEDVNKRAEERAEEQKRLAEYMKRKAEEQAEELKKQAEENKRQMEDMRRKAEELANKNKIEAEEQKRRNEEMERQAEERKRQAEEWQRQEQERMRQQERQAEENKRLVEEEKRILEQRMKDLHDEHNRQQQEVKNEQDRMKLELQEAKNASSPSGCRII